MWECPEFFALDGGHVLIWSTAGKVFWQSGRLDTSTMLFHSAKTGELDVGAYYAPKTQLGETGQRILWGWIPERRPEAEYSAAGWAGVMSLPRVLHLDADGTLRMKMLPALNELRGEALPTVESPGAVSIRFPEANGEMECSGAAAAGFDFVLTTVANGTEVLKISWLPDRHAFSANGREIALSQDETPRLHLFLDASVAEMILGERTGYTARFYGAGSGAAELTARIEGPGVTASAWKVRPISSNRLTTPG
uniref:Glycosyl hydrolase family 32 N-terminal domain-containing protein n=2 Tax=Paracidobacterium acidisoli TaxID=2303751 RepID=A0A372IK72_9BACT|nr:hypothetical protein [Paracidobacterium acidisoli]